MRLNTQLPRLFTRYTKVNSLNRLKLGGKDSATRGKIPKEQTDANSFLGFVGILANYLT
jgi:hypothetical protein